MIMRSPPVGFLRIPGPENSSSLSKMSLSWTTLLLHPRWSGPEVTKQNSGRSRFFIRQKSGANHFSALSIVLWREVKYGFLIFTCRTLSGPASGLRPLGHTGRTSTDPPKRNSDWIFVIHFKVDLIDPVQNFFQFWLVTISRFNLHVIKIRFPTLIFFIFERILFKSHFC